VPQLARLSQALIERGALPDKSFFFRDDQARQAVSRLIARPSVPRHAPAEGTVPSNPTAAVIAIRELCHRYPGALQPALRDVSLDVVRGEWLAVIGVNGSGKSTLIKHLNGLLKPTSGQVSVDGHDTRAHQVGELARMVSYLPQNPDQMIFSATVRQEVAYGPRQFGLRGQALDDRVTQALDALDLRPYADHPPAVLGYGTRRKVALASALAVSAPILALDEPTTGLDRGTIRQLMEVISRRHRQGTTVIMITHDLQLAAQYAQRTAVLHGGRLVTCGSPQEVLADIEGLAATGLAPVPVTRLAHALGWAEPLPLDVEGFVVGRRWTT
jgi:energy-coupling factor transport system ATP-binding protein